MNPQHKRPGISLLEVIIATAILAASGIMLMSMFSTGDRHTKRAEERSIAQMLCRSKLDELLADKSSLVAIEAEVDPQFPGWVFGVAMEATQLEGFVKLAVRVTRIPGMDTGADLDLASKSIEDPSTSMDLNSIPEQPTYELIRWIEFDGDVMGFGATSSSTSFSGQSNGF